MQAAGAWNVVNGTLGNDDGTWIRLSKIITMKTRPLSRSANTRYTVELLLAPGTHDTNSWVEWAGRFDTKKEAEAGLLRLLQQMPPN